MPVSPPSQQIEPSGSASSTSSIIRPFENAKGLLVLIPDKIDVEEEARLYEELCDSPVDRSNIPPLPPSPREAPSIFSRDIWLGDNKGESQAFTQSVEISGWTSVGDKAGGAYIVFDCAIKTKEGTTIHVHKRYSAFAELYAELRATLPRSQQHFVPTLPPKSPLSKFRSAFLERRRRLLQYWLSAVLLHPDIGGYQAVREWVMS